MKEITFLGNLLAPVRYVVRMIAYPLYIWGMGGDESDVIDRIYLKEKYRRERTPGYSESGMGATDEPRRTI